jgi:hypothetical protein
MEERKGSRYETTRCLFQDWGGERSVDIGPIIRELFECELGLSLEKDGQTD